MKFTAIIWLALCALSHGSVYNDPVYTATKDVSKLIDSYTVAPKWGDNGEDFWYVDSATKDVFLVEPAFSRKTKVLSATEVDKINAVAFGGKQNPQTILKFIDFSKLSPHKTLKVSSETEVYTFQIPGAILVSKEKSRGAAPRLLESRPSSWLPPQTESVSPKGKVLASKLNRKLALRRAGADVYMEIALNEGEEAPDLWRWDLSSVKWSPKGDFFSILRRKQSGRPYSIITDWSLNRPALSTRPHITPLDPIAAPKLYIVNVANLTASQLSPPVSKPYHYVHQVGWSALKNEPYLAFSAVDRYYRSRDYYTFSPGSPVKLLFTEKSKTYLHDHMLNFRNSSLKLIEGLEKAYFLSERSGARQIYTVDLRSGSMQRAFGSNFIVEELVKVDAKNGILYMTSLGADKNNPYHIHLHVAYAGGPPRRITELGSTHGASSFDKNALGRTRSENVVISPNGNYIIDSFSNHKEVKSTRVIDIQGKVVMDLGSDNATRLKKLGWKAPEAFKVKAADGKTNLYGLVYRPFNFDPKKKYPVVDFIYAGPQYIWTPQAFHQGQTNFAVSMAQLGHIVVVLDGRGTPGRGKDFQDHNYKRFGQVAVYDHMAAIKGLAQTRPYMDLDRVGVAGSSFGGFQTMQFMTRAPNFFKAGVANASVADLRMVNAESVEIYMGDPKTNQEAYEQSSVANHIHKLKGKLLIMHGAQDINAPLFGMMSLMERMISEGIMFDQLILPSVAHSRTPYVWEKMRRYLHENL